MKNVVPVSAVNPSDKDTVEEDRSNNAEPKSNEDNYGKDYEDLLYSMFALCYSMVTGTYTDPIRNERPR